MTLQKCLEYCTRQMSPLGYFPWEIEAAAEEMFEAGWFGKWPKELSCQIPTGTVIEKKNRG